MYNAYDSFMPPWMKIKLCGTLGAVAESNPTIWLVTNALRRAGGSAVYLCLPYLYLRDM